MFYINFLVIPSEIVWEKSSKGKHFSKVKQRVGCQVGFWMQVSPPSAFLCPLLSTFPVFLPSFHSSDIYFWKIYIIYRFKLVSFVSKVVTLCRYSNGIDFYKTSLEHISAFAFKISFRAMWEKRVLFHVLSYHTYLKLKLEWSLTIAMRFWYWITSGSFLKFLIDKRYDIHVDFRKKMCYDLFRQFKKRLIVWDHSILEMKQIFVQLPSQFKVTFKWFNCGLKITYRLSH